MNSGLSKLRSLQRRGEAHSYSRPIAVFRSNSEGLTGGPLISELAQKRRAVHHPRRKGEPDGFSPLVGSVSPGAPCSVHYAPFQLSAGYRPVIGLDPAA
jgi:hypothetical protein